MDYDPRVGHEAYRFLLRMPQALRHELRSAAEANGRSLNAEIVARLEETAAPRSSWVGPRAAGAVIAAAVLCAAVVGGAAGSRLAGHPDAAPNDGFALVEPGLKRLLVVEPLTRS